MTFHTLNELIADGVRGRYILVRSDLNVPLDGSTVTDDGRIKASLPVLAKLTDAGARVLVTAHLGRPKGDTIRAEAKIMRAGRMLIVVEVRVLDSTDNVIAFADFSSMVVARREPLSAAGQSDPRSPDL